MEIEFYVYSGENNRINKTPLLSGGFIVQATAREPMEQVAPEVDVRMNIVPRYNYARICFDADNPAISTCYYYVEEMSIISPNLTRVSLRRDPLMSFKDAIFALPCVCNRCEKYSMQSPYIYDKKIAFSAKKSVQTYSLGSLTRGYVAGVPNIILVTAG